MQRRLLFNAAPRAVLLLVLAILVGSHVPPRHATGFRVRIASDTCECRGAALLLHVSAKGLLWGPGVLKQSALANRLSEIYGTLPEPVLYLSGDDNVPFQKVVDVIATVQQSEQTQIGLVPLPEALRRNLNIEIRLVTPGAVNMPCPEHCYNWGKREVRRSHDG